MSEGGALVEPSAGRLCAVAGMMHVVLVVVAETGAVSWTIKAPGHHAALPSGKRTRTTRLIERHSALAEGLRLRADFHWRN